MRASLVLAGCLLVPAIASCGNDDSGAPAIQDSPSVAPSVAPSSTGSADTASTTPSSPASITPSSTQATTAKPTASASAKPSPKPTRAADGRNLRACEDRTCEVEVRSGDRIRFARKWAIREFVVERVAGNKLYFTSFDTEPSPLRGWVGGTGNVETADIHVDITPFKPGRTILRFRPR